MKQFPIIGLTGYARVGKDTAADYIADSMSYEHLKFADPIKSMARAIGLGRLEIEGALKEQPCELLNNRTPREFMQELGTDFMRERFGADVWVKIAMKRADSVITCGGRVVFSDVRFSNEAEAIRLNGGVVIKIRRPGFGPVNAHVSDNIDVKADAEIVNGGDVIDLCDAVDFALSRLVERRFAEGALFVV